MDKIEESAGGRTEFAPNLVQVARQIGKALKRAALKDSQMRNGKQRKHAVLAENHSDRKCVTQVAQ